MKGRGEPGGTTGLREEEGDWQRKQKGITNVSEKDRRS